jgi:hypothetical protein
VPIQHRIKGLVAAVIEETQFLSAYDGTNAKYVESFSLLSGGEEGYGSDCFLAWSRESSMGR